MTEYLMYGELASWWPLLSPAHLYREQAEVFAGMLEEACTGSARTLLELGSGGGHTASHLHDRFACTLLDASEPMLAASRQLNPGADHIHADMATTRLDRQFDVVLVHDAIMHATDEDQLRAILATAFHHCRPGGAALFAPDDFAETFAPSTETGGEDDATGRAARYLAWACDPDPDDCTTVCDFAYLLRDRDGHIRTANERMTFGLFSTPTWLELLQRAGFRPSLAPLHAATETARAGSVLLGRRPETV